MRHSHAWSFIARNLAHGAQHVNPISLCGTAQRVPVPAHVGRNAPVNTGIQKRDFAQTLARGLEVLQAFNVERPHATTTQIAEIAGISRAAARRILLTLRELGYVEEVTAHYWRLTPKVLRLGFAFFSSQSIWSVIADDVRALAQEVNEPCAVAVLDGTDILYVIRDSTRRIISTHVSPGERLPAYAASLGKVLLAALPDSELERYFEMATFPAPDEENHHVEAGVAPGLDQGTKRGLRDRRRRNGGRPDLGRRPDPCIGRRGDCRDQPFVSHIQDVVGRTRVAHASQAAAGG